MSRKKTVEKALNPELVEAINKMLKEVLADASATLLDKMRVVDRALQLEKIKQKNNDDDWGSGFGPQPGDEDEA